MKLEVISQKNLFFFVFFFFLENEVRETSYYYYPGGNLTPDRYWIGTSCILELGTKGNVTGSWQLVLARYRKSAVLQPANGLGTGITSHASFVTLLCMEISCFLLYTRIQR